MSGGRIDRFMVGVDGNDGKCQVGSSARRATLLASITADTTRHEQQAEATKPDAAIEANLKELGYGP
ncbi:MAG: hypothetical protein HY812_21210 [Planctomycetes bacterium]|nr:hypothetical protein [Planctomycetota bacterium]